MHKLIKLLLLNKMVASILLKPILKLHTLTYKIAGIFASILNHNIHPKHKIIKYKEWFADNIKKDWVVLDIGCNNGMVSETISDKASFIYGIDIQQKHIKEAKSKISKKNIKFICADATTYDYAECKTIDVVILSNVLEHIEYRVDFLQKLLKQVKWNNKKRFLIRVPMIDRDWITVYKKELGLEYRLDRTHFIEYTFKQFENELNLANIKTTKYHVRFGELYAICEAK